MVIGGKDKNGHLSCEINTETANALQMWRPVTLNL